MSFACRSAAFVLACLACAAQARELRVCADPDNLPISHEDGTGFEDRIARLVASEMGAELRYEWTKQVRGYVRKTLAANLCDVFIGVPAGFERVMTTRPYYRSSYVFVDGPGAAGVQAFDDTRIASLPIGVALVGSGLAGTPPCLALARAGRFDNVRGFPVLGEA